MRIWPVRSTGDPTKGERLSSSATADLQAGDLIWIDFDPRTGREQSGRRPALVISPSALWEASRFAIVCPITSKVRPFASSVVLPEGLPLTGEILTSQVRSVDTLARPVTPLGAAVPAATLAEVRAKLSALLGMDG
ncbi:type II toxin-antitoxin system PemK/MazF family toxin [Acidisoma cladoniae]|jgi:mRNA interferase MazF|uniref:type II toxin-antitoxin system PemK/MazF family toxin n=1 Tax=Acidisoma cladoniae TaxID=3040935 RepID=UPI00254E5FE1|nr:type II toxin-antitoxin system PemK/MazF family toxin [Acidisoma sp. PAMC 29798]